MELIVSSCVMGELHPSSSLALCTELTWRLTLLALELSIELTYGDDTCNEWCVLELLKLQNLLRKLVFLWVSNPLGSCLHLQTCSSSQ